MKQLIEDSSNENLECLCSLLTTVGSTMASENEEGVKSSLGNTLRVLHDVAYKSSGQAFELESRVRFKILDTIDLSKKNWMPRMVENNPKKIDQIREESKEDKLRQQQYNHSSQNRNMIKSDDRPRRPGGGTNSFGKNQIPKWS